MTKPIKPINLHEPMAQAGVVFHMILETGINPMLTYCQFSGAPIGPLALDEWNLLWSTIDPTSDIDSIIDELYMRTILSMRPSPAWNYITPNSLTRLRRENPLRVCAYLLGRYYLPRDHQYSAVKRTLDQRLTDGANRIAGYNALIAAAPSIGDDAINELSTILLMIDSQFGLDAITPFADFPTDPRNLSTETIQSLAAILHDKYLSLVSDREAALHRRKLEDSYFNSRGNQLAKSAAADAFMSTKPAKPKTKREQEMSVVTNLLTALMDGEDAFDIPEIPKAKPAIAGPIRLANLKFPPKDSSK